MIQSHLIPLLIHHRHLIFRLNR